MKKFGIWLPAAVCLAVALSGCGAKTEEKSLTKVRLNEVAHSIFYIASSRNGSENRNRIQAVNPLLPSIGLTA